MASNDTNPPCAESSRFSTHLCLAVLTQPICGQGIGELPPVAIVARDGFTFSFDYAVAFAARRVTVRSPGVRVNR
jgi:hypothetical protein